MYCPNCRIEYQEGIKRCSDCGVALVEELPPEPQYEYVQPATVFSATDENLANIALSLLDSAGIRAFTQDSAGTDVFGVISPGFPVAVQVMPEDVDAARQILAQLDVPPTKEKESEGE